MNLIERPVGDLLREAPERSQVFKKFAIDYGCGNELTLAEACYRQNIDPELVVQAFKDAQSSPNDGFINLRLDLLAAEIVEKHHHFAREQGTHIQPILSKVCRVHGRKEPRLLEIQQIFQAMHQGLLQHMLKEENVLFPFCKRLEFAIEPVSMGCGSVANPIGVMESDHEHTRQEMQQIKDLSDQFTPPEWACNSFRVLFHALQTYIEDLETHMHLESDLLFPAALRREEDLNMEAEAETPLQTPPGTFAM